MQYVKLSEIVVPPRRIRRFFDEVRLRELRNSIATFGLFHPILTRTDGRTLVAGERRLRAIESLSEDHVPFTCNGVDVPLGFVPILTLADLAGNLVKEAELQENIIRVDITWQERANAINDLHELRKEEDPLHRMEDTAIELGFRPNSITASISPYLTVAKELDDREIASAKDIHEALKLVERKRTKEHHEALAKEFGIARVVSEHKLIKADLFEALPALPDNYFDCIIFDPPYGIDADTFQNQQAAKHTYSDSKAYSDRLIIEIFHQSIRIAKYQAHLYMFCDINRWWELSLSIDQGVWKVWPWPLIWHGGSGNSGLLPRPNHGPRRTYEAILYAIKGDKEVVTRSMPDVIEALRESDIQYAAKKPEEAYYKLLQQSCKPGDRVLDPCCGSGPIFPAATRARCVATGIDNSDEAIGIAMSRMGLE